MDKNPIFTILTNIIMKQNSLLLKEIAKQHNIDEDYLMQKYLQPSYYLPVISSSKPSSKPT
jgi:hypothetical protein